MVRADNFSRTVVRFVFTFADDKKFQYLIYKTLKTNNSTEILCMICAKFLTYYWTCTKIWAMVRRQNFVNFVHGMQNISELVLDRKNISGLLLDVKILKY